MKVCIVLGLVIALFLNKDSIQFLCSLCVFGVFILGSYDSSAKTSSSIIYLAKLHGFPPDSKQISFPRINDAWFPCAV